MYCDLSCILVGPVEGVMTISVSLGLEERGLVLHVTIIVRNRRDFEY